MELAKRLRHGGEIALQHEHVARPELHRAEPMRNAPSTPTHGEEIDAVAAEQLDLPGRATNELGFRRDHCFHDPDLVMRRIDLLRLVAACELQLLQRHDTLKRGRLAL